MINFELKNNISDAIASGRGLSSAPWMNCNKSDSVMNEVQNVKARRKACDQVAEAQVCNSINKESKLVQEGGWQSGRSMIEMLGVLAIIGVLSVGGIAGYSKAMTKYRINKAIEQITLISGNIRSFFGQQKNYAEVACDGIGDNCTADGCLGTSGIDSSGNPTWAYNGCPIIKKAKIFPDEMIEVTDGKITAITNPFGGWVRLLSTNKSTDGDDQAFRILYFIGDNMEACIELLTQDWSVANVKAVMIGNRSDYYFFKTPVAVDDAVTYCSKAISETPDVDKVSGFPGIQFFFDIDLGGSYWNPKPVGGDYGDWNN